jgi:adenylate kinase family enzyme
VKRVLVLGNAGSGKSWLAARIGARLGMEVIHLDQLFWKPGWVARPLEEFSKAVDERLTTEGSWVADGNYLDSLPMRAARSDTIIVLDVPTWRCLARVVMRSLRSRTRSDMADGCEERILRRHYVEFLAYVLGYRRERLPRVLEAIESATHARVIVLRTQRQIDSLLELPNRLTHRRASREPG